jgi:hypothetical protein
MRKILTVILLILMAGIINLAIAEDEPAMDILSVPGIISNSYFIDLDNDKIAEGLVFFADESSGEPSKKLALFTCKQNRYGQQPVQILDIESSAVCFDFADMDGDGIKDLALIVNNGIIAHLFRNGSFAALATQIVKDSTIFNARQVESLARWDFIQRPDTLTSGSLMFIPTVTGFNIYAIANGKCQFVQTLNRDHVSTITGSATFENERPSGFRLGCAIPAIILADYNGDKRADIFIIESRTISIHRRNFDNKFDIEPTEIFGQNLLSYDERHSNQTALGFDIHDLNNDGIADIVVTKNTGDVTNYQTSIQIYRGKAMGGYNSTPSDKFSMANGASSPYIYDLNKDGRLDLILPSLKLGFMSTLKILLLKNVEVNLTVYLQTATDQYTNKPDYEKSFSYNVAINQSIDYAGILTLDGDYNGDGLKDLLIHEGDGVLKIFPGVAGKIFESSPSWQVTIPRPDGLDSPDLNGNGKSEIVAHYQQYPDKRNSLRVIWPNQKR